ncbi:MAG: polysaccharide deacetylase family protein, partial [Akkermansiaceae bacterium]|nr:polysaccharide deacetylase family protein [Akkermansiaceae bacterium]
TLAQTIARAPLQAKKSSNTGSSKPGKPTRLATKPHARVTVLGYHDFSSTKDATEMLITTGKFRRQMQAIKDLGLKVITLEEFIAWKNGKTTINDRSVLITIDDGWKSIYTDAFPILKEMGFPFTIFLYTNYINGGSNALTSKMIKEMQQHGCSIGSHSVSHPYPKDFKAERAKGDKSFQSYLHHEMGQSRKKLQQQFGGKIRSYAYPGGFVTGEMLPIAAEHGYQCLFTVIPGKTTRSTSNFTIPRYIILGTHDYIFRNATSFKATNTSAATIGAIVQTTPHPVIPEPGSIISTRLPSISADLSKVENIDPASLVMRVTGFGKVPVQYDPARKIAEWRVNRRLRSQTCEVSLQWHSLDDTKHEKPMTWTFLVNRQAAYQLK